MTKTPRSRLALLFPLIFALLWQGGAMWLNKPYLFPSLSQIAVKIYRLAPSLFLVHLPATYGVALLGLLLSLLLGGLLAWLMDAKPTVEAGLYPLLVSSQTIPLPALAPLFILWFGYGATAKVLVTLLMTFFPIAINLHAGLKAVRRDQIDLLMSYGAGPATIFWKLKLPASLPSLFAALKMALPLALIGAALSEWLGGDAGLGYFSRRMITQLDGPGVFAPIVLLSLTALLLLKLIDRLESRLLPWRGEA